MQDTEKYNYLTIVSTFQGKIHPTSQKRMLSKCICDCGQEMIATYYDVKAGKTQSCGCKKWDTIKKANTIHGLCESKEFHAWNALKGRCYNKNNNRYKNYGARGITVCDRWLESFQNFITDMGEAPSKRHSIERKDNNKNYEPGNCRWATVVEQSNNRTTNVMIAMNGEKKSIAMWCRDLGLNRKDYNRIRTRISSYGWPPEKAFEQK